MANIYNILAGVIGSISIGIVVYLYVEELRLLQSHVGTVNNISAIAHMIADLLGTSSDTENTKVFQTIAKTTFSGAWVIVYDTSDNGKVLIDGSLPSSQGGGWQGPGGSAPNADQREALESVLNAEKDSVIKGLLLLEEQAGHQMEHCEQLHLRPRDRQMITTTCCSPSYITINLNKHKVYVNYENYYNNR